MSRPAAGGAQVIPLCGTVWYTIPYNRQGKRAVYEAEQAVSKMNTGDTEEVKKAQKVLHGIFKLAGTVGETINIYLTTKGTQYENMNRADKKRAKKNKK